MEFPHDGEVLDVPLRPAALFIDMQEVFLDEIEQEVYSLLICEQLALIRFCIEMDIPVILIQFSNNGETISVLQTQAKLAPRHCVVYKSYDSGFERTGLDELLAHYRSNALILSGVFTSACVYQTACKGDEIGYELYVAWSLVADRWHHSVIPQMRAKLEKAKKWYNTHAVTCNDVVELVDFLREEMKKTA